MKESKAERPFAIAESCIDHEVPGREAARGSSDIDSEIESRAAGSREAEKGECPKSKDDLVAESSVPPFAPTIVFVPPLSVPGEARAAPSATDCGEIVLSEFEFGRFGFERLDCAELFGSEGRDGGGTAEVGEVRSMEEQS